MAEAQLQIKVVTQGLPGVDKLNASIDKLNTAANKVQGSVPKATNNIKAFGRASATASSGVKALGVSLAATLAPLVSIAAVAAAAGKAINVAFERSAAEQKLRNFTSSTEEYEVALALAAQTSEKFGLSQTEALTSLADMNSRLRGLGFGLKEVSELQQGFQAIVLQSGTSAEDAAGAFLQLSQALGSGVLQGDELRSILERMPLLTQNIADSMGVSTGEIKALGAEGKLTSDIIYKALSEAAAGSDALGNKLSESQVAMKAFGQAADQAFAVVGETLGPIVVKAVEAATFATRELAKWWEYLAANVFPQVQAAIAPLQEALAGAFNGDELQIVINLMQNGMLLAIQGATAALANMSQILALVINGFKALTDNPVFEFIADQVGRLANQLGLTGSKVNEFKENQKGATDEIAKGVDKYSQMPEKIEDAKGAQKELTASLKEADAVAQSKLATLDQELKLGNARLAAEKAINGVLLQQAERRLSDAKSAEEQIKYAQQVYDLTLQQAKIEYETSLAAIDAMVRKAELAAEAVQLKYKEVQAAVALAEAEGVANEAHYKALEAQGAAVQQAQKMLEITTQVATEQRRAADAVYAGAQETARAAFEQNKVWQNTQGSAAAAGQYADNMGRGADEAERAARAAKDAASWSIKKGATTQGQSFAPGISQEAVNEVLSDSKWATTRPNGDMAIYLDKIQGLGYVKWTQVMNDYTSAMQEAQERLDAMAAKAESNSNLGNTMNTYSRSGGTGSSVSPQVNIQTGPVTQMDGTNYVTTGDLQTATSIAAQQGAQMALDQLKNDPGARRYAGVGR